MDWLRNFDAAVRAMRNADGRIEHAKVVVDLGDGANGGSRTAVSGFLLDGDGRAQAVNGIHLRPFHLIQELPSVGRQRLHVAALPFRVDGVEGERGFPRSAQPGHHGERVAGDLHIDILQVVLPCPMHGNAFKHWRACL